MEAWGDGNHCMLFDEDGDDSAESAAVIDGWQDLLEGILYPVATPVPDPGVLPFNGGAVM
jgi:hypothetical protein